MDTKIIELDKDRIIKRLGYSLPGLRMFIVKGIGYVGACEIITEGPGSFGQSGRAVVVIRNFIKFCRNGNIPDYTPPEYLVKYIPNARIDDENILKRITNAIVKYSA